MHLTRQFSPTRWPIARKGTKYIAVPTSHISDSVPLVVAIRDMLHLAKNAKEVHQMIKLHSLKINGKEAMNLNDSITLFQILDADKSYRLSLLPTGKFFFEEAKDKKRLCKIIGKKILSYGIQYNLHDGSNLVAKEKFSTNDSVYLSMEGKLLSHVALDKGKNVIVISGKYEGLHGKVESVSDSSAKLKIKDKEDAVELPKYSMVAI